jgi:hypothetical protein
MTPLAAISALVQIPERLWVMESLRKDLDAGSSGAIALMAASSGGKSSGFRKLWPSNPNDTSHRCPRHKNDFRRKRFLLSPPFPKNEVIQDIRNRLGKS